MKSLNQKKCFGVAFIFSALLMSSCSLNYLTSSQISDENVQLGMTKQEVMNALGDSPYKQDYYMNEITGKKELVLYYREHIYPKKYAASPYDIISILHFVDNKLVSVQQDDIQQDTPSEVNVNVKKEIVEKNN